jgi:hypothetical protein
MKKYLFAACAVLALVSGASAQSDKRLGVTRTLLGERRWRKACN